MRGRLGKTGVVWSTLLGLVVAGRQAAALGVLEYYVGPASGVTANWNNTANWSATSGGPGGAAVPANGNSANIVNADGVSRTVVYDYTGAATTLTLLGIDLTGGTNNAANVLSMAGNTLTVSGGEDIGISGRGIFIQSGGTNTITAGSLVLAESTTGSTGIYFLSGASSQLSVSGDEFIGNVGSGVFSQSGGTNTMGGFMILGETSNSGSGSYTLNGGILAVGTNITAANVSQNEVVGYNAMGTFTQTGGSNTVGTSVTLQNLYVGYNTNVSGAYVMDSSTSAATLTVNGDEVIGYQGNGSFAQNGGAHTVFGDLYLAQVSGNGSFTLSGGSLAAFTEIIGDGMGDGNFTQSGGNHTIYNTLDIGSSVSAIGSYVMNSAAATLMVNLDEILGEHATGFSSGGKLTLYGGTFNQSAGTHIVVAILELGEQPGASGMFTLSGGSLMVSTTGAPHLNGEEIGFEGTGNFLQSGGTHTIGTPSDNQDMSLGVLNGAVGTFTMNSAAATLTVNGNVYAGGSSNASGGTGVMNISAGTATVTGMLKIWPTTGSAVNLSGGALYVGTLDATSLPRINWTGGTLGFLGNVSVGTGDALGTSFSLNAGQTLSVAGTLTVDPDTGSFTLNGGKLTAQSIIANQNFLALTSGSVNVAAIQTSTIGVTMPLTMTGGSLIVNRMNLDTGGNIVLNGTTGSITELRNSTPGVSFVDNAPLLSIGSIEIVSGGLFTVGPGNTIMCQNFVVGSSEFVGSTVAINGGSIIAPTIEIGAGGTLEITSGGVSPNFLDSGDVDNSGQLLMGGYASAAFSYGGSFSNGGIISGSGQISGENSAATALNNMNGGVVSIGSVDHLSISTMIVNLGQINIIGGILQTDDINNQPTGIISLAGGTLLTTNSQQFNSGNVNLFSGIFNASGAIISGYGIIQGNFPIDNAGAIQLSGGSSSIYPAVTNESGGKITVTGGATATFYGAMTLKAGSALTVGLNSTAVFFGAVTGTATITGAGVLDFEGGHSVTPALANLGGVTVGGLGFLTTSSVQVGAVVVEGNLVVGPGGTGVGKTLNTANSLLVSSGASWDLTNTDLMVHSGSAATVAGWVALGEIHSSAATVGLTGLGVLSGANYLAAHGNGATFDGATVAAGDVLVRYTYLGDATLDGKISAADYAQIDAGYLLGVSMPTWFNGDFNLDGVVNYKDYVLIDNAYRNQSGVLAAGMIAEHMAEFGEEYVEALAGDTAAVPEPGALGILVAGMVMVGARRRRR